MKRNDLMIFAPHGRDRERLPCFPLSVLGRPIECADQSGTMRVLPGDRMRVEEIRGDHALVTHVALKGAVLLTDTSQLHAIHDEIPATQEEDARL